MKVSVIVPCYNERGHIFRCIKSIGDGLAGAAYDYEILVIDGGSNDGTLTELQRAIAQMENGSRITVIENPLRFQVHGLNMGLSKANGEFIVRCDAHSEYPPGYVAHLVQLLMEADENVGNVGTPHVCRPGKESPLGRCIAFAMTSPLAVGLSHRSLQRRDVVEVDTLLFGAWRRTVLDKVGGFDARFVRGQDLEHNLRLRSKGYKVLLHPGPPFSFYTRPDLQKLGGMIRQYAAAKLEIVSATGGRLSTRALVPISFFSLLALLLFSPVYWLLPLIYVGSIAAYTAVMVATRKRGCLLWLMAVIPVMHVNHASGMAKGWWSTYVLKRGPKNWVGTR